MHFADVVAVFEDENALWQEDVGDYDETRYVALGMDHLARIVTVVFTFRGENIRLSQPGTLQVVSGKRTKVEDSEMKQEYDFSNAKRGSIVSPAPKKTRITIRIDTDILNWFREKVNASGGGSYQTLINQALREHMENQGEDLEAVLRRVLREELQTAGSGR